MKKKIQKQKGKQLSVCCLTKWFKKSYLTIFSTNSNFRNRDEVSWPRFETFFILGRLGMQRFWTTDGNRKCAVFVFYFSSHYHINVVESLFTSRYDQFENLRETTVLACEMSTSGWRPWLKNVACLSSLLLCHSNTESVQLKLWHPPIYFNLYFFFI